MQPCGVTWRLSGTMLQPSGILWKPSWHHNAAPRDELQSILAPQCTPIGRSGKLSDTILQTYVTIWRSFWRYKSTLESCGDLWHQNAAVWVIWNTFLQNNAAMWEHVEFILVQLYHNSLFGENILKPQGIPAGCSGDDSFSTI